jgi:MFS family permease
MTAQKCVHKNFSEDKILTRNTIIPVLLTLLVQILVSLTSISIAVIMPVVANELNFSPNYVGIFVSLIYLGACLSSLASGFVIDRYGPIFVSAVCLAFCSSGLFIITSGYFSMMVMGAIVIGLGYGPVTPASSFLLVKTTPSKIISTIFSIKQTGVPIGGAIAGIFVPVMVVSFSWKIAVICIIFANIISILAILQYRKEYDIYCFKGERFSIRKVFLSLKMTMEYKAVRIIVIASFFYATMQLCLISFIVTYLIEKIGLNLIQAGFILSVTQAAGIIGRLMWGAVADKFVKPHKLLGLLGIGMSMTAILTAMFTKNWPSFLIFMVCGIFGSFAIGWNGVFLAEVAGLVKHENAGTVTGGALFFTFCGIIFGLPFFSFIVDFFNSYSLGFIFLGILTAICGFIITFQKIEFHKRI